MKETREEYFTSMAMKIQNEINLLEDRLEAANDKWVVASDQHVFIGPGKGIGCTGFAVRGVAYPSYPEYPSFMDAQRNIDPYLIDGSGNPIYNKPMRASLFYFEEIVALRQCLTTVKEYMCKV